MATLAIDSLLDNSETDFDLYVEIQGQLSIYATAPYKWTREELTRLLEQGLRVFYYFTAERPKVEAYRLIHLTSKIDTTSPPAQRIVNLSDAAAELTRVLYGHPLTATAIAKGGEIAKAMIDCIGEDRRCVSALGLLANHDYYTYYHSARVAAYALAVAMQLSARDQSLLQDLAIGCLLHDVGKSKVDLAVLNKQGALTKEEWELMKKHPVFGDEIVANSLLNVVPRGIILHHHERLDGSGYPHNLSDRELLEEVKIAAFADVFDALTTNRPYQVSRNRFEALDFIKHKLSQHVHKASFQAMVELLGEAPEAAKTDKPKGGAKP
jgi:HD-GYP domain-containing protein (c-di-GMP phosphodiesterase class II)